MDSESPAGVLDLPDLLPSDSESAGEESQPVEPAGETSIWRIEIPALEVERTVLFAPRSAASWDITGLRDRVAWLEGTSAPGQGGNTVLVGHVTVLQIGKGPFYSLQRLKPGDLIRIHGGDLVYVYSIQEQKVVRETDIAITAQDGPERLTLLTCSGWNEEEGEYVSRRAVIASLVRVEPGLGAKLQ